MCDSDVEGPNKLVSLCVCDLDVEGWNKLIGVFVYDLDVEGQTKVVCLCVCDLECSRGDLSHSDAITFEEPFCQDRRNKLTIRFCGS